MIITEPQKNLKRVDVIITWDEVQVENGNLVLDANGNLNPGYWTQMAIRIRRINSDHFFIHRDAQYFLEPGG